MNFNQQVRCRPTCSLAVSHFNVYYTDSTSVHIDARTFLRFCFRQIFTTSTHFILILFRELLIS